ncbi:unnamed protein product, partial [marine sediment metagenome]
KTGQITITDERMTRFWITQKGAAHFIIECMNMMRGGEVFVPKIPSMSVYEVAQTIAPSVNKHATGIRAGEKLHEALISSDESRNTLELHGMYIIQPTHQEWSVSPDEYTNVVPMASNGLFSDTNTSWLTPEGLLWRINDAEISD